MSWTRPVGGFLALLLATAPAVAGQQILTGAGATFPYPLYSNWFASYSRTTGVRINYQSIGSGGGIRQFIKRTVDFGATDGPMKDEQMAQVQGNVLHVPTVIGSVAITYNLKGLGRPLRLDARTLTDIYLGRITSWQDERIRALNPGAPFPKLDIVVVQRSDGSGTTFVFTDYLAKVSPDWSRLVGRGTAVRWPVGLGGKGNEGVTAQVKLLEGGIGYVELGYALANRLPYAELQNASGGWVLPSLVSSKAAAASLSWSGDTDFRVSITNAPGTGAYPISSFTWLLVPLDAPSVAVATPIRDFLRWMLTPDAQRMAERLHYASLPDTVVSLVRRRIGTLRAAGRPIP